MGAVTASCLLLQPRVQKETLPSMLGALCDPPECCPGIPFVATTWLWAVPMCGPGLQRAGGESQWQPCPCVPVPTGWQDVGFAPLVAGSSSRGRKVAFSEGQWEPPVAGATAGSLSLLASLKEWCGEGLSGD